MARSDDPPTPDATPGGLDVVVPQAPTDDGRGLRVMRLRDDSVSLAELRPVEDGKPITGEVVRLTPREPAGAAYDVEVVIPAVRSGPPQVATAAYRHNWDAVFGESDEDSVN